MAVVGDTGNSHNDSNRDDRVYLHSRVDLKESCICVYTAVVVWRGKQGYEGFIQIKTSILHHDMHAYDTQMKWNPSSLYSHCERLN
jgi:hypothetical protein